MTRARSLVWLVALLAFAVPSFGTAAAGHAMASAGQMLAVDCPDHAAPPGKCPSQDTAKHAAGECCPPMMGACAVMPPAVAAVSSSLLPLPVAAAVRGLVGVTFTQDPPPPRV
jgi:hypothetical protein